MKVSARLGTFCVLILAGAVPARAEIAFEDDFNDGNAAGWEEYNGVFSVDRGAYRVRSPSSQSDARTVAGDPSWTDVQFRCDIRPANCARVGVLFRVADIGPGWGVGQYYELCFDGCSTVTLFRVDGPSGPGTEMASAPCSLEVNAWHHLQVDVLGESMTATLDGRTVLACDGLTHHTRGRIGLKAFAGGIALFDNVSVAVEPFPFSVAEILRTPLPTLRWSAAGRNCLYTVEAYVPETGTWTPATPIGEWPQRGLAWSDTAGGAGTTRRIYRVRAERSPEPLPPGMSARFDGQDDWIEFPSVTGAFESFTVQFWIFPRSRVDWNQGLGASGGWGQFNFHTTRTGAVYAGTDLSTRFTPSDLPAGTVRLDEWQHFAYVHDNGIGRFYRNGALMQTRPQTPPESWSGFRCGSPSPNLTIHGDLDELRIHARALDDAEIAECYNDGWGSYGGPEPGLIGGWHFDEGAGTTAYDFSGNARHGTLRNGAGWGEGWVQP